MAGMQQIMSPVYVKLKIAEEIKLGRNVYPVYHTNEKLINQIKTCITSIPVEIGIVDRDKKPTKNNPYKNIGINADSINYVIRERLKTIDGLCFETSVEYGGFFERKTKSNFDFSFYDKNYNFHKFWNHNCNDVNLNEIISSTIQDTDKDDWSKFVQEYNPQPRVLTEYKGEYGCNIVGEIQMGNWALIYKDIFRLLRAKNSPGVDLYIYITNTGTLKDKLSDGVVTYSKALSEIQENLDVIDVPILILGIDLDSPDNNEFIKAHQIVRGKKELIDNGSFIEHEIDVLLTYGFSIDEIKKIAKEYSDGECYQKDTYKVKHIKQDGTWKWFFDFNED